MNLKYSNLTTNFRFLRDSFSFILNHYWNFVGGIFVPVCSNCGKEVYDRKYCQHCGQLVSIYHSTGTSYQFLKILAILSIFSAIFWFIPLFFQILYLANFNASIPLNNLLIGLFLISSNCIIYFLSFLSYRLVKSEKIKRIGIIAWSLFALSNVPFIILFVILG